MNDNENIFNNSNNINVDSTNVNNTIDTSTNNVIPEPVQNNKLIGAVTHVIVDDCEKGYGIFITKMLEESEER